MLTPAEVTQLDGTLLPALERHHLRLLAHGLRTLQAVGGATGSPLPERSQIEAWAVLQPAIAADPQFQDAFVAQLLNLGHQLASLAAVQGIPPLALDLPDLIAWAEGQASDRLGLRSSPQ